ncbi:MAG: hypothetical protein M3362_28515 [Acidobacteriota bacterium]|nr:hypothetical protein [Acidobacteriota bacterium]
MRLPWGDLREIESKFLYDREFVILGSLSFEQRCCAVPILLNKPNCLGIELLEIKDPADAFPDNSSVIDQKRQRNKSRLKKEGVKFSSPVPQLLSSEDQLIDMLQKFKSNLPATSTAILDITSLPKRYFCFFLKRMLRQDIFSNVIVTYTEPGLGGYATGHLAEDPMTCEHLPGYSAPLPPKGSTLVVSVGFESLSIKPLLEIYSGEKKETKIILAFPPNGENAKRQWNTLRQMVVDVQEIRDNLEVVAAWDTEQVYRTLERWSKDSYGLTLAPFGPKAHSLGMALFAIKYDAGLYYTQPKSYNPDYSSGEGRAWAYVVKWDAVPCYERYAMYT